ncbi:hypothetical protein [Micromonospora thermarum]|uniref:hypothetical protein n=1 Tax=Micromonospora thermarum TaxID=2720024 RepID=UPI001F0D5F5E|nr:hypothetical protein [Micromonospora thermarum]
MLPKPRTRVAWASWADDLYNRRSAVGHEEVWRAQAAGADTPMMVLPVGDPAVPFGKRAVEPRGLSEAARRRRALADQVANALANQPTIDPWRGGTDVIVQQLMPARLGDDPAMRQPFVEAAAVVERGGPGVLRVVPGDGGVALRVHGPPWSLVFRVSPVVNAIVVFLDATSRYGWRVEDDTESRALIEEAVTRVVVEAARYGWGGDKHPSTVAPVA